MALMGTLPYPVHVPQVPSAASGNQQFQGPCPEVGRGIPVTQRRAQGDPNRADELSFLLCQAPRATPTAVREGRASHPCFTQQIPIPGMPP